MVDADERVFHPHSGGNGARERERAGSTDLPVPRTHLQADPNADRAGGRASEGSGALRSDPSSNARKESRIDLHRLRADVHRSLRAAARRLLRSPAVHADQQQQSPAIADRRHSEHADRGPLGSGAAGHGDEYRAGQREAAGSQHHGRARDRRYDDWRY